MEAEKENHTCEEKFQETSGIEDVSSPILSSQSTFSTNSNLGKQSTMVITDNPNFEVKFSGIDNTEKDSIMSSSSSSSISSEFITGKKKPKIPDGGWGWMVVLASLILSMIADGISFSFGLLYVEFLKEFHESKAKTAWIGSLFMAVPLLSGPIMSAFVDRYGCRKMTIAGGLIAATGFVLSFHVNSIEVMYVTFGVIAGLGLGLCYVTAVVSVAFWFDKRRTLAVGLAACGTGVGTFVYAPLTQFLIEEYAWRGTILLLAGTFLHMCICGCLMRDPDWWTAVQNRNSSIGGSKSIKNSSYGSASGIDGRSGRQQDMEQDFPGIEEIRNLLKDGRTSEYVLTTLATTLQQQQRPTEHEAQLGHCRSVVNLPTFVRQSEKVPLEVLEALSANTRLYNIILENYPSLLLCRSTSDKGLNKIAGDTKAIVARVPLKMSVKVKRAAAPPSLSQAPPPYEPPGSTVQYQEVNELNEMRHNSRASPKDIILQDDPTTTPLIESPTKRTTPASPPWLHRQFSVNANTHNYLKHIRLHRNSVMYRGAMLNIHKYRMRASSCPNIYKNSMTTLAKENQEKWYADILETLRGMADFSMLLEFHFLLTSISTILLFIWFIVPYFYLVEYLSHYGLTETDTSKLLSIIGITNTIGMIGLGWAGDQPWMHVTKTYGCCLILCGISTICMVYFVNNYIILALSCAFFGLFFASTFCFTPVILVELVPLDRFTTAYGLMLLCQGIGNLLGPPLAGWIFDITHSWDTSFTQAGLWIIVSGLLMLIIPYTNNRKIYGTGPLEKDIDRESNSTA